MYEVVLSEDDGYSDKVRSVVVVPVENGLITQEIPPCNVNNQSPCELKRWGNGYALVEGNAAED